MWSIIFYFTTGLTTLYLMAIADRITNVIDIILVLIFWPAFWVYEIYRAIKEQHWRDERGLY